MKIINILGYSNNIFPLLVDTINQRFANELLTINLIQNIEIELLKESKILISKNNIKLINLDNFVYHRSDSFVMGVFNPKIKHAIYEEFFEKFDVRRNFYEPLIHPSSVILNSTIIEYGVYIEPLSVVSALAKIGFNVSINRNSSIGHHTIIEDYSTIAPGVNIGGNCRIGKFVTIGIGATVFNKVNIGNNSIIGGGSVVTKDIPENVIAYGNPCKIQSYL